MGYPYSATYTVSAGDTILAVHYNTGNSDHINNNIPESIDDYSANAAEMQALTDPYPAEAVSLATTLDGEIQRLRYVIKQLSGEAHWYIDPNWEARGSNVYELTAGLISRSKFEYIDANTIFIGAGQYWCKDKFCWWDAQLTSTDIGTPTASTWVYLYLDYSAITSGTEITNTELIWSEDPPAYSHASRAWLRTSTNTDDRCIMAVYSDGSQNITEFYHDENLIIFADSIGATIADSTPSDTFSDITFIAPTFSIRLQVTIRGSWVDAAGNLQYRTNGQTGSTGHEIGAVQEAVAQQTTFTGDVIADSSQIIEVRWSAASAGNLIQTANIIGWYFGVGI